MIAILQCSPEIMVFIKDIGKTSSGDKRTSGDNLAAFAPHKNVKCCLSLWLYIKILCLLQAVNLVIVGKFYSLLNAPC